METDENLKRFNEAEDSLFPIDIKLEDVRAAISGRNDFREIEGTDYIIFVYFLGMNKDIFPPLSSAKSAKERFYLKLRRECRGLVFSKTTKQVISRRFHKFFNVNEMDETNESVINLNQPYILLEKLDGSMIAPFFSNNQIRFGTKSGITDTAIAAEKYIQSINSKIDYIQFSQEWISKGFTPIFEWCSSSNPIVLRYDQDQLNLITLRNMRTGHYIPHSEMVVIAKEWGIPVVRSWSWKELGFDAEPDNSNFHAFYEQIQSTKGVEGFVMRFDDGSMLKIKTHWYFGKNHALDKLKNPNERHRWEAILGEVYDDVRGFLREDEREATDKFARELFQQIDLSARRLLEEVSAVKSKMNKREYVELLKASNRADQGILLHLFDKMKDSTTSPSLTSEQLEKENFDLAKEQVIKAIQSSLGTPKKFEQVRKLLAGNISFQEFKLPPRHSEKDE